MKRIFKHKEQGFSLIEVIVAVALIAIIGVGLLAALGGASKVLFKADTRETARDLAQAQMEYILKQDFADSYTASTDIDDLNEYSVYTTTVQTPTPVRDGLQKITIDITQGANSTPIFTLEGYKVDN